MPDEKLQYVIDIIRESADFDTEQEEIDIEIDKIDTVTQRKLQNFVLKNKPKQRGKTQKNKPAPASSERDGGRNDGDDGIAVPKNPLKAAAAVTERTRRNRRGAVPAARLIERKWLEKEGGDPDVGQTELGWRGAVGRIIF